MTALYPFPRWKEVTRGQLFTKFCCIFALDLPRACIAPLLHRTTILNFESDARGMWKDGEHHIKGGCVVVFRREGSDREPFGIWLGWIIVSGHLFIIDLQNKRIGNSLQDGIAALDWAQEPRPEAFFAPFRRRA